MSSSKSNVSIEKSAYRILEFCHAYGISRAKLYELWRSKKGPKTFRVGRRVLISIEAAEAWRSALESQALGDGE
jgi:predicted DNA-binding transcriptional regulator AlpA